jgi:CRP-like cAMP-binding protein
MGSKYFNEVRKRFSAEVDDFFIEDIIENGEFVDVKKNEVLVAHQTLANDVYFIIKGSFIKNVLTPDNEEKPTMFHTDSFFYFMVCSDSYRHGVKTDYIIRANEDSIVLIMKKAYVNAAKNSSLGFLKSHAHYLESTYESMELLKDKYLSLSSEEYLKWLYEHYPFIILTFPSKDIASFMGITPVWYSNLKRKVLS